MDVHYYEAHVTIAPVFDAQREQLLEVISPHRFKLAPLLMRKSPASSPEPHREDAFLTGRGRDAQELLERTLQLVRQLEAAGFMVWRYKTESTLVDSRYDDAPYRLRRELLPERELNPRPPV